MSVRRSGWCRPRVYAGKYGVRRSGWCRRRHHWDCAKGKKDSDGVRRSGWCRRRHPMKRIYRGSGKPASVDQVGADVGTVIRLQELDTSNPRPSIRLVPTSAPYRALLSTLQR